VEMGCFVRSFSRSYQDRDLPLWLRLHELGL
jgi:hypothetical protein